MAVKLHKGPLARRNAHLMGYRSEPGMGGVAGANMGRPGAGGAHAVAEETDSGKHRIPGRAPGLNPYYGNYGTDESNTLRDPTPRTRKKRR